MRRWHLGYPLQQDPHPGGRPFRYWINLFLLAHRHGAEGWRLDAWPDGQCLTRQSWALVLIFRMIGDELNAIASEGGRRTGPRIP